ncbi:ChrR family anti-sigma-E factor [Hyphomonas sp.]|jgi:putative transcriptional regulator|uniref:ChrR family anti-sigma-E factor n=1 Tax=Hyphomonas sp. TaxID=87 RepID=UPI0032D8C3F8
MMQDPATSSFSELYSAYAAGRLDPAFALLLETQSMLRTDVRGALAVSEAISGSLLESADPVQMSAGAGARALDLINALETEETPVVRSPPHDNELADLPAPLRDPALDAFGAKGWQGTAPGIRRMKLDMGSDLEVELYRIQPGAKVPRHTHGGKEFTLVVSGGFSDETGSFGPGDLAVKGPDDTHQPVGDAGEVCFALAVRDAGLKFTGVMGLIQRVLGQ